jgi:hypothetical protein
LGFYAELRRELGWGNWKLDFFDGLLVVPRRSGEEGGQLVCFLSDLGEFYVSIRLGFVRSFNALQVICRLR